MIDFKATIATLKVSLSSILIGGIWLGSSNVLAETVFPSNYTSQHSDDVAKKVIWSDSNGEPYTYSGLESTIDRSLKRSTEVDWVDYSDSIYTVTDFLGLDWEVKASSQDWLSLNRGDGSRDLVRLVIWRF